SSSEIVHLLTKQLTEPPPPLPESVPLEVRELVGRLVEKDPNKRTDTADAVVAEIDRAKEGTPPATVPTALAPENAATVLATAGTTPAVPAARAPENAATVVATAGTSLAVAPTTRSRVSRFASRMVGRATVRIGARD